MDLTFRGKQQMSAAKRGAVEVAAIGAGVGKAAVRDKRAERIQALRDQQAREARRKVMISVTAVVAVIAVVAVLVVVKLVAGSSTATNAHATVPAPAAVSNALATVPAATYDAIGSGTSSNPPTYINGPALTAGGKPRVLYVGAEYCPFCAAERWAMTTALARFGTWKNLGVTWSSSTDVHPNTPTLSFHGATFTSPYISFTGVETQSNQQVNGSYPQLDNPSAADTALLNKYDNPPYVSSQVANSIPFVDIGGKWMISGADFDPTVLAGKTQAQIASALADPTSAIAKAAIGGANVITAAICDVTGNSPASVCNTAGVKAAAKVLKKKG